MNRLFETLAALVAALGLHASALHFLPQTEHSAQSAGDAGADMVSVMPSDSETQAMIAAWKTPPEIASDGPQPSLMPEMPTAIDLPDSVSPSTRLNSVPALPAIPAPDATPSVSKTVPAPEPAKKVKAEKDKQTVQPAKPQQKAKGVGGGVSRGNARNAQAATSGHSGTSTQKAKWGAEIRARIERRKSYPSAANGAKGRVVLQLRVAADGRLVQVGIAKSSGNTALDGAAVAAVKSVGRFPKAPKGVSTDIGFTLPMSFKP